MTNEKEGGLVSGQYTDVCVSVCVHAPFLQVSQISSRHSVCTTGIRWGNQETRSCPLNLAAFLRTLPHRTACTYTGTQKHTHKHTHRHIHIYKHKVILSVENSFTFVHLSCAAACNVTIKTHWSHMSHCPLKCTKFTIVNHPQSVWSKQQFRTLSDLTSV